MAKKNRKDSILDAAKSLFSVKGYDAAGMDEIAASAGVPKSLIYYHFKNKEALLDAIITEFLGKYESLLRDGAERGVDKISRYIEYLRENKDSAKIMIMESLAQTGNQNAAFRFLDTLKSAGTESGGNAHWTAEFFTSIMPALLFVCYEENWSEYYDVPPGVLAKDFLRAYALTHGAYHEHIKRESL